MRKTLAIAVVLFVVVVGGVAIAQNEPDAFSACLTPGGDLTNVAIGSEPLKECKGNSVKVGWNEPGPNAGFGEPRTYFEETWISPGAYAEQYAYCAPDEVAIDGGFMFGTGSVDTFDEGNVLRAHTWYDSNRDIWYFSTLAVNDNSVTQRFMTFVTCITGEAADPWLLPSVVP